MTSILLIAYGVYMTLTGIKGNATKLSDMIQQEHQFLYWIIVLLVITALWESPVAEDLAKSFAVLIVLGFLLTNNNYKKIGAGLMAALKASPSAATPGLAPLAPVPPMGTAPDPSTQTYM